MKVLLNLLILLLPAVVFAAGGHGGNAIPKSVIYQAINVAILIGGLVYFTKDGIVAFFSGRKTAYLEAAQKSAAAREQAEKEFVDIKTKLTTLDQTRNESLQKAQAQAEELKNQMLVEAAEISKRIKQEAELTAKLEVEKAQKELRTQLLKESVEAARMVLTKDLGTADQENLQKEFINNVGV